MNEKKCRVCGEVLNDENWYPSYRKRGSCICKKCSNEYGRLWQKDNPNKNTAMARGKKWKKENPDKTRAYNTKWRNENPDKLRAVNENYSRKKGIRSFTENKDCSSYLGVHVAERVLRHTFKDVVMMSYGNPGYDFVCNKGMLVDGKSSCLGKNGSWSFAIRRNKIADYFVLLAFDNRDSINPLYCWMIPGDLINHLMGVSISPSNIHKWDEYRIDIDEVISCCDEMKDHNSAVV